MRRTTPSGVASLAPPSGRHEELQGVLLLAASALVMTGTTGGQGQLGEAAQALMAAFGLAVFYPALVLALWGTRRFQHQAAWSSRTELAAWAGGGPVLLAALEKVRHGTGGRIGFWLGAYLDVLFGPIGAWVALLAASVVLLCIALDLSPRILAAQLGGIVETVLVVPARAAIEAGIRLLTGLQHVIFVGLRDLWIVIDLVSRRLERAAGGPDLASVVAAPVDAGIPTPVPPPEADLAAPSPPPEPPPPVIVAPRDPVPPPPGSREPAPTLLDDDLLSHARMARAVCLRRGARPLTPEPSLPHRPTGEGGQERALLPSPVADAGEREPTRVATVPAAPPRTPRTAPPRPVVADPVALPPGDAPAAEEAAPVVERPMEERARPRIEGTRRALAVSREPAVAFELPPLDLFDAPPMDLPREDDSELHRKAELIRVTLKHFGIESNITRITCGPTITQFELVPAAGVKLSRVTSLADDLAMSLAVARVRIEAPIPGRGAVGIEVPNKTVIPVYFQEIAAEPEFRSADAPLTYVLGKGISGAPVIADLGKAPHMLVAGATGAGKSVCVNTLICSLLVRNTPSTLRFLMVDPKRVELMVYDGIPHLIAPVITDPGAASAALKWAVLEMERRYRVLSLVGYRNIQSYNEAVAKEKIDSVAVDEDGQEIPIVPMAYLVIVIDELADLMMVAAKDIEDSICRLAQMARAVGMHLIVATQRPSTNVITGIIKANLPTRIAFRVASKVDSKVILDHMGAEALLGRGDMLWQPVGQPKSSRIQGAFVQDDEIKRLVAHLVKQGPPEYLDVVATGARSGEPQAVDPESFKDEYLGACIRLAVEKGEVSTSMLQRHFKIGYNRAANIIDVMEARGIVSGPESGRRREVRIGPGELERLLEDV